MDVGLSANSVTGHFRQARKCSSASPLQGDGLFELLPPGVGKDEIGGYMPFPIPVFGLPKDHECLLVARDGFPGKLKARIGKAESVVDYGRNTPEAK